MTAENLSHAAADRYADRMMHDVRNTSQLRYPPRPPPTISARESLAPASDESDGGVVSARVAEEENGARVTVPPPRSMQERLRDFVSDFETLEPMLSTHLSSDDKRRVVRAIQGPGLLERPEVVTVAISALVVLMTAMVCLGNSSSHPVTRRSRAAATPPPPPTAPPPSSATNFNIDRILAPLSRHR